jgi:hypothetical protein
MMFGTKSSKMFTSFVLIAVIFVSSPLEVARAWGYADAIFFACSAVIGAREVGTVMARPRRSVLHVSATGRP